MGNRITILTETEGSSERPQLPPMTEAEQGAFWRLYAERAQPAIERACRTYSRSLTDNQMSAEDMQAWVDDRVWRMCREGGYPLFHEKTTVEEKAERVAQQSKLLARWAYTALSRKHWRRKAAQSKMLKGMSRAERLAAVSDSPVNFDKQDEIKATLEMLKSRVNVRVREQLAASWPEEAEARKAAVALGAVSESADSAIEKAQSGETPRNTIDQVRSRARREAKGIMDQARKSGLLVLLIAAMLLVFTAPAFAGEQTGGRGGRGGRNGPPALGPMGDPDYPGEQTGGRNGPGRR